jgi:hypothetical protein
MQIAAETVEAEKVHRLKIIAWSFLIKPFPTFSTTINKANGEAEEVENGFALS